MGRVVAAQFETFAAADSAAHALFAARHSEDAVAIFYANAKRRQGAATVGDPELSPDSWSARYGAQASVAGLSMAGAVSGAALILSFHGPDLLLLAAAAIGASFGSWVGALWLSGWKGGGIHRSGAAHASVILTIQVRAQDEPAATEILNDAGGLNVERVRGRWRHGLWTEMESGPSLRQSSVGDHMVMY